jgi:hypothetical protein
VALRECLAAEEDLVAQPLPHARLSDALADEGGVTGPRAGTLPSELAEQPVGLQPRGGACPTIAR